MLALNRRGERPAGAIDVDATQPLGHVVDELLRLTDCATVIGDSNRPPWSKRDSPIGRSFVIPESAVPMVRDAIDCIEYSWSGSVLATLLAYLSEQGIDLASAQIRAGSVFVLTSDHRERYLARLDPIEFDGAVLRGYYERFNETAADGVEYAMLDGIAFFRDTLAPLEPAIVAVLIIE